VGGNRGAREGNLKMKVFCRSEGKLEIRGMQAHRTGEHLSSRRNWEEGVVGGCAGPGDARLTKEKGWSVNIW